MQSGQLPRAVRGSLQATGGGCFGRAEPLEAWTAWLAPSGTLQW
jgi:hypothetical protein